MLRHHTTQGEYDLLSVLVWWKVNGESGREKIRANPLYAGLDVATQGRDIFLLVGDDESNVFNERSATRPCSARRGWVTAA